MKKMIRKAEILDGETAAKLAVLLWPEHPVAELTAEFTTLAADPEAAVFLAFDRDTPVGFAQCQLRHDYVEGTSTSPVGYLEGVFVREEYRRRGVAKKLILACENWAAEQGCAEFASDCELTNQDSQQFHLNAGFEEANRIICFTKKLPDMGR